MVDCPPASVPSSAPHTIQLPLVPPVVKLRASLMWRPDNQLTASNRPTVTMTPMRWTIDTICDVKLTVLDNYGRKDTPKIAQNG